MLHHRTTDPSRRAEHIANREEKLHEQAVFAAWDPFDDDSLSLNWPRFWLDVYQDTLNEVSESPCID